MDPFVGAALVGAGANIIGNIFGSSSNSNANRTNLKIARENNQFTERMWNLNNEYNSPVNQMKLLQEAGLNPITYSDAAASPTAQQVSGNMSANQRGFNPNFDISDVTNALLAKEQLALKEREISFMEDFYKAQADKVREETTGQKYTNEILKIDSEWKEKMTEAQYEELKASVDSIRKNIEVADQTIKESQSRVQLIDAQTATEDMLRIPRFNQLCADANLKNAQARESAARTAGFLLDNQQKELDLEFSKDTYKFKVQLVKNEKEASGLQIKLLKVEEQNKKAESTAIKAEANARATAAEKEAKYNAMSNAMEDTPLVGPALKVWKYACREILGPTLSVASDAASTYGSVMGGYGLYKGASKLGTGGTINWPKETSSYSIPSPPVPSN